MNMNQLFKNDSHVYCVLIISQTSTVIFRSHRLFKTEHLRLVLMFVSKQSNKVIIRTFNNAYNNVDIVGPKY